MLTRRAFLGALGVLTALLAPDAQSSPPVIGYLSSRSPSDSAHIVASTASRRGDPTGCRLSPVNRSGAR